MNAKSVGLFVGVMVIVFGVGFFFFRDAKAPKVRMPNEIPVLAELPKNQPSTKEEEREPEEPKEKPTPPPRPVTITMWDVPMPKIDGRDDWFAATPKQMAVNNSGTYVMVAGSRLVDVWEKNNPKPARYTTKYFDGAYVTPDAENFFVLNGDNRHIEMFNFRAKKTGSFNPSHTERYPQHMLYTGSTDPKTGDLILGLSHPQNTGFYSISATSGLGQHGIRISDASHTFGCRSIHPITGTSDYLVNYIPDTGNKTAPNVLLLTSQGAFQKLKTITNDPKVFGYSPELRVSPDSRWVAVVGNRKLKVWSYPNEVKKMDWEKEYYYAYDVHFCSKYMLVATMSDYEKRTTFGGSLVGVSHLPVILELYDLDTLKKIGECTTKDHKLPALNFAFSPDGSKIVFGGREKIAVVETKELFDLPR